MADGFFLGGLGTGLAAGEAQRRGGNLEAQRLEQQQNQFDQNIALKKQARRDGIDQFGKTLDFKSKKEMLSNARKDLSDVSKMLSEAPNTAAAMKILQSPGTKSLVDGIMDRIQAGGGARSREGAIGALTTAAQSAEKNSGKTAGTKKTAEAAVTGVPAGGPTRIINKRLPNGDVQQVRVGPDGQEIGQLGPGGPSVQFQPTSLPNKTELKDFRDKRNAALGFIQDSNDFITKIEEGGEAALGTPGGTARLLQDVAAGFRGFAGLLKVKTDRFDDGTSADTAGPKAETIFQNLGVSGTLNAQIKSDIVNLAFAAAAAKGSTGRAVSDQDYKNFLKQIGGNISDPKTLISVIRRVQTRINRDVGNSFDTLKETGVQNLGARPDFITDQQAKPLSLMERIQAEKKRRGL